MFMAASAAVLSHWTLNLSRWSIPPHALTATKIVSNNAQPGQGIITPHKVRTKERHLSWIGSGLASVHMYVEELKWEVCVDMNILDMTWRDWAPI